MIIDDVSQKYNHKSHDTDKTCHLSEVSHMIINDVEYIINMLHHDGHYTSNLVTLAFMCAS